jgi:hypothetical protein
MCVPSTQGSQTIPISQITCVVILVLIGVHELKAICRKLWLGGRC